MSCSRLIVALLALTLVLAGCGTDSAVKAFKEPVTDPVHTLAEQGTPPEDPAEIKARLAELQVNEAGKIMILMYHVIGAPKEGDWVQTADNFRRDLRQLWEEGYSLLSLKDLVENNIATPAGRTPVVLTFDDGTAGHFRYLEQNGEKIIDPDCAVGILLDFAKEHPEFGHTATFFINDRPFGQKEYWEEKLRHLVELGFDLGNHTLTHPYLNKLSNEQVQKEMAGLAKMVEERVPGYKVSTLALPFGISPQEASLALAGSYDGYSYEHQAVLRVGANPTVGPAVQGFEPARLPRVQASTVELSKWLEYFRKRPQERYISDGDPATIAVPTAEAGKIRQEALQEKTLLVYDEDIK